MARPGRGLAFWTASGASGVIALTLLHVASDKFPNSGLAKFRDYLVRRNG